LVIVDAFAGRGKYTEDEPGSPLLLLEIAARVASDGVVDEVELFFIEKNEYNCEALKTTLGTIKRPENVKVRGPRCATFVDAARLIIDTHLQKRPRPSFWFLDPFGFTGVPLPIVREILRLNHSEAVITYMVRDINRFLTDKQHRAAIGEILGLDGSSLDEAILDIVSAPSREIALRELYERRLREVAGARYVWTFRVAARGQSDTIYYLMHVSRHVKAFREMKKATRALGGWRFAFLGRGDFSHTGQLELPEFGPDDTEKLKALLLTTFAGRDVEYVQLLNEAVPDRRFYWWVDSDFRSALSALADERRIEKIPVTSKTLKGLQGFDRLRFS